MLTAVGVIAANVSLYEDYAWMPAGLGIVSFVVLFADVGIRYRVDRAGIARAASPNGMFASNPPAARLVSASPLYVGVLTLAAALSVVSGVLGTLVVVGLNASYETLIVDRAEGAPIAEFAGLDIVSSDLQICGDGEDYWACTAMHQTMWNSLCTGVVDVRTPSARQTCNDLEAFVEEAWDSYSSCGRGCKTRTGQEGRWGYSYLRAVPQTRVVQQPRVTHYETCYFDLGPIKIGYCPRG